jgi:hypothetical protein
VHRDLVGGSTRQKLHDVTGTQNAQKIVQKVEKMYVLSVVHAKVTTSLRSLPDQSFLVRDISITIYEDIFKNVDR